MTWKIKKCLMPRCYETIEDGCQIQLIKHDVIFTFAKDFVVSVLFLYFTVLFAFYACKKDTSHISNQHETKIFPIYKSLGKSKDKYIYKYNANVQDATFSQS